MLLWDSELHWRVSQSVKSRSPRSVLDHSHADFSGRARHPSVCFPSSITRFYFQDLNILRFFFSLDLPDFADTATNDISLCFASFFLHDCENILIIVRFICCQLIFLHGFLLTEFPSVSRFYSLSREVLRHQLRLDLPVADYYAVVPWIRELFTLQHSTSHPLSLPGPPAGSLSCGLMISIDFQRMVS